MERFNLRDDSPYPTEEEAMNDAIKAFDLVVEQYDIDDIMERIDPLTYAALFDFFMPVEED